MKSRPPTDVTAPTASSSAATEPAAGATALMAGPGAEVSAPLPRGLRGYLFATAAVTGAAIMIVEILGAKMLAPFVGTSHFVWTAQIAVTLGALATGYWAGGRLADWKAGGKADGERSAGPRSAGGRDGAAGPSPAPAYAAVLGAALYLCLTVAAVEPIAYRCLALSLPVGSLLASAFLFFVPLALLATTGPVLVRALTVSLSGVGRSVGRLSAIGTFGSLGGTALIGYVLIPLCRNSVTMYLTAAALAAVGLAYFAVWGRLRGRVASVLVVAVALWAGAEGVIADAQPRFEVRGADASAGGDGSRGARRSAWTGARQLYRGNSNFGEMLVFETADHARIYLNDFLIQNTYEPRSGRSMSLFTYMLHGLTLAYCPRPEDVLCIGMGVGIVPRELARDGARVDVVEINPAVVPLAERFFGFDPSKVNVTIGDGRQFLNAASKQYDAIVLDAFLGDSSPSHLMTKEAFTAMRKALRPGGVLVINSFCQFERGKDFFAGSLHKTLAAVFASVRVHASGNGNVFFVASDVPDLRRFHDIDTGGVYAGLVGDVEAATDPCAPPDPAAGIVLTDDYNPVDYYDAANREGFRRSMTDSLRRP